MDINKILMIGDLIVDTDIILEKKKIIGNEQDLIYSLKNVSIQFGGIGRIINSLISYYNYDSFDLLTIVEKNENIKRILNRKLYYKLNKNNLIVSSKWFTPNKIRVYIDNTQEENFLMRFDREYSNLKSDYLLDRLKNIIDKYGCVFICDYNKGVINNNLFETILEAKKNYHFKLIVDTKIKRKYTSCDILKMNLNEYIYNWDSSFNKNNINEMYNSMKKTMKKYDINTLIITSDANGLYYADNNNFKHIPTIKGNKPNYIGSGDYLMASFIYNYIVLNKPLEKSLEMSCMYATTYYEDIYGK